MIEEDKSAQSQPGCAASLATSGSEPSAQFTPGPWFLRPSAVSKSLCIYAGGATNPVVAYGIGEAWNINDNPENDSNARLIAAAPDLYEALKEAVAALEVTLTWPEGWECSEDDLLGRARAALARADSRQ